MYSSITGRYTSYVSGVRDHQPRFATCILPQYFESALQSIRTAIEKPDTARGAPGTYGCASLVACGTTSTGVIRNGVIVSLPRLVYYRMVPPHGPSSRKFECRLFISSSAHHGFRGAILHACEMQRARVLYQWRKVPKLCATRAQTCKKLCSGCERDLRS